MTEHHAPPAPRRRAVLAAAAVLAAPPRAARAQPAAPAAPAPEAAPPAPPPYPARPVRIVVAYAAGGGTDLTARAVAEALTARFRQSFVVENRPGANGVVGSEAVARAAPDGHTLLAVTGTHVMNRQIVPGLPFDPATDFTPIAIMARYPLVLMANADAPFRDVPGLIAHARENPGRLAQGTSDAQSSYAANQFAQAAGIRLIEVPYRGSGAYLGDLTGGHLKLAWGSTATAMPLLPGGRVRVIAVTSPERSAYLPDAPTMAELGLPQAGFVGWNGLYGPARMPPEVAEALNRAVVEAVATPPMRARFRALALDPAPLDLEALAALLREDEERWARAAREGLLPRGG